MPDQPLCTEVSNEEAAQSSSNYSKQPLTLQTLLNGVDQIFKYKAILSEKRKKGLSESALKRCNERELKNQTLAIELIKKFSANLACDYGEESNALWEQLFSEKVETPPYAKQGEYAPFYNHNLYCQILPLCQLVFRKEQNGCAEAHAFKLSLFFNDIASIASYLREYTWQNEPAYPVHDACLFDLPSTDSNFYAWKKLSQEKGAQGKINLLNPRFRVLLPHAPMLEKLMQGEKLNDEQNKQIAIKQRELEAIRKDYKKINKKPQLNPTEMDKEKRKRALSNLRQKQSLLSLELATLAKGIELLKTNVEILSAFYEQYLQESNPSQRILIEHGISERDISLFYSLDRNDSEAIPNLTINSDSLGYRGYYLTKLNILSDEGAAIAACLGKMTDCCQHLGGIGTESTQHGISSELGGFYVLWRGDPNHPSFDDEVIAQSWAWRAQTEAICLDSIEAKNDANQKIVIDMYRALAIELCSGAYPIKQVNTGAQSGITRKVALRNYPTIKIESSDFYGYNDSASQLYLADRSLPYLFLNRCKSERLNALIKSKTEVLFDDLFKQEVELSKNEVLKKAVAFSLYFEKENGAYLLKILREKAGSTRQKELEHLIEVNRAWIAALNQEKVELELLQQGAYINAMSPKSGRGALHIATLNADTDLVRQLVEYGAHLDIQDRSGNTPLINALETVLYERQNNAGRDIANYLVSQKANLDIKDKSEVVPLLFAVQNKDLYMVKCLVEAGANIEVYDADLKTALFWSVEINAAEIFNYLLKKSANINLIAAGISLLMAAARYGSADMVRKILARGNINFKHTDELGQTSLFEVNNPESLELLLQCYPETERLTVLNTPSSEGEYTPLHRAAMNGQLDVFQAMLKYEPDLGKQWKSKFRAMHLAVKAGKLGIVRYLVESNLEQNYHDTITPLRVAIEEKQWEIALYLLKSTALQRADFVEFLTYGEQEKIPEEVKSELYNQYVAICCNLDLELKLALLAGVCGNSKQLLFHRAIAQKQTAMLAFYLKLIKTLDPLNQIKVLSQTDHNKCGLLELAWRNKDQETVEYLLDSIHSLSLEEQVKIVMGIPEHVCNQLHHFFSKELNHLIQVNRAWIAALNQEKVELELLQQGANINAISPKNGRSALHVATLNADTDLVKKLVERGADIDIQDRSGHTPLINALETVLYERQNNAGRDIANYLVSQKANLDIKDKNEVVPLLFAVQNRDLYMVKCLVKAGANIEAYDADLKTALFWSVEINAAEIFNYLFKKSANINLIAAGISLLMAAARYGSADMVRKILAKGNINFKYTDELGQTSLFEVNNPESLELLLQCYPETERLTVLNTPSSEGEYTPLHRAARAGRLDVFQAMLKYEPDLGKQWKSKFRAMHLAVKAGRLGIVRYLVESNLEQNYHDTITPLRVAIEEKQWEIALYLLKSTALQRADFVEFLTYGKQEKIPEEVKSELYNQYFAICCNLDLELKLELLAGVCGNTKLLLFHRAVAKKQTAMIAFYLKLIKTLDPLNQIKVLSQTDHNKHSLLELAWRNKDQETVEYLLDSIQLLSLKEQAKILMLISEWTCNQLHHFFSAELIRQIAINREWRRNLKRGVIKIELFQEGADVSVGYDEENNCALHLVATRSDLSLAKTLTHDNEHLNIQNNSCITPLISAVKNKNLPMVKLLVSSGAALEIPDIGNKTALYWAAEKGYEEIFDYLYEQNARVDIVATTNNQNSLLMAAVSNGNVQMVAKIISRNSQPVSYMNKLGVSALFLARTPEMLRFILDQYPESERLTAINRPKKNGHTLLSQAAEQGLSDLVCCLIEMRADVNQLSATGYHPLYVAAACGHREVVNLLVDNGANPEKSPYKTISPLQAALNKKHFGVANLLFTRAFVLKNDIVQFLNYPNNYGTIIPYFNHLFKQDSQIKMDVLTQIDPGYDCCNLLAADGHLNTCFITDCFIKLIKQLETEDRARTLMLVNKEGKNFLNLLLERDSAAAKQLLDIIKEFDLPRQTAILNASIEHTEYDGLSIDELYKVLDLKIEEEGERIEDWTSEASFDSSTPSPYSFFASKTHSESSSSSYISHQCRRFL